MMGRQTGDQSQLFYLFNLERRIPAGNLLRRINPVDAAFESVRLRPILETAAELGAKRLSVCGDDADGARLCANVASLADLAQPFGMGIDIENMAWRKISSFAQAVQLAKDTA